MNLPAKSSVVNELALIGEFDEKTKEQWRELMHVLHSAGVLEERADVMQADMAVRAYQRFQQLDQVEYDVLANFMNSQHSQVSEFQKAQQLKLDGWLQMGTISADGYQKCMRALTEACNARHSNLHNLLNVVSKAKFQAGQFFNKAGALAAFTRSARKAHGSSQGHDMERLAKGLRDEVDELSLADRGGKITTLPDPGVEDVEFDELVEASQQEMFSDIRSSIVSEEKSE